MSKFRTIINGWTNYINSNPAIELMAMERAKVCGKCEHAKEGMIAQFMDDEVKQIKGLECALCMCPLSTKLRAVEETCLIDKW